MQLILPHPMWEQRGSMNTERVVGFLCAGVLTVLVILSGESKAVEAAAEPVPIRIGWQIPAATQAQIVQVLKRTDILDSHGLDPSLVPFSYGGPQVDAAFAASQLTDPDG
jgi:hypothetical protein